MSSNETNTASIEALIARSAAIGAAEIEATQLEIDRQNAANRADEYERAAATLRKNGVPDWAIEYAQPLEDFAWIELPGCSPIRMDWQYRLWEAAEPMKVEYADRWRVKIEWRRPLVETFEAAVSMAAEWGESYDEMNVDAARRNAAGEKPGPIRTQPAEPAQPSRLDRIVIALEKIAENLYQVEDAIRDTDASLAAIQVQAEESATSLERIATTLEATN